jgi:hypothetical protein
MTYRITTSIWYNLDIRFFSLPNAIFSYEILEKFEHTANACDLLQSKIWDDLYKSRSSTITFPNKVRDN